MVLLSPPSENDPEKVRKLFHCPVCNKMHEIYFPPDFAKDRSRYPFTYIFMHKFEDAEIIDDKDKDILTTLYIDAQLNIRGVEAIVAEDDTNILSKEVSKEIVTKLTQVILEMQEEQRVLIEKYASLEKKLNELSNSRK